MKDQYQSNARPSYWVILFIEYIAWRFCYGIDYRSFLDYREQRWHWVY